MIFTATNVEDVEIVKINLQRATSVDSNKFKTFVMELLDLNKNKIVVDFSECDFIDSTFLSVLVTALKKIVQKDGDLRLTGLNKSASTMFTLTGMNKVFKIFSNELEAVGSFK